MLCQAYADRNGFMYFETSAKSRVNVDKALTTLTETVFERKVGSKTAAAGAAATAGGAADGKVVLGAGQRKGTEEGGCVAGLRC